MSKLTRSAGLTIVGHAHCQALLEAAVLALVAVLFLDFAAAFALVILQLQTDSPPKKPLEEWVKRMIISIYMSDKLYKLLTRLE